MVAPELLAAVVADPFDDEARLAYAAGCEREDPARAELIRLQVARGRAEAEEGSAVREPVSPTDPAVLVAVEARMKEDRERQLLAEHGERWTAELGGLEREPALSRGFVAQLTLPASDFLEHGEELRARTPILRLNLTGVQPLAEELFTSRALTGIPALGLTDNGLATTELIHLVTSPHLGALWWLDLRWNRIDFAGVKLLASSRHLPRLAYVGLEGNSSEPMETVGVEGYQILDASLPPDGVRLEELYGRVPWIHYPGDSTWGWPPDPLGPPPASS